MSKLTMRDVQEMFDDGRYEHMVEVFTKAELEKIRSMLEKFENDQGEVERLLKKLRKVLRKEIIGFGYLAVMEAMIEYSMFLHDKTDVLF